eukprot:10040685-Alexandrium_andersonii.AAC.1
MAQEGGHDFQVGQLLLHVHRDHVPHARLTSSSCNTAVARAHLVAEHPQRNTIHRCEGGTGIHRSQRGEGQQGEPIQAFRSLNQNGYGRLRVCVCAR